MPELSAKEIVALVKEEELKRSALIKYNRLAQSIGQLQANIEEMEREGRTKADNCPPLDNKSPANAEKSQYDISRENLQSYLAERDALVAEYPRFFEPEEVVKWQ